MKKLLSVFTLLLALSSLTLPALAEEASAPAVPGLSQETEVSAPSPAPDLHPAEDAEYTLSLEEGALDELLLPGETYEFPLFLSVDGQEPQPVRERHIKDWKFRVQVLSGREAVSSFRVEEIDGIYHLRIKTQPGWPAEQTKVTAAIRLVERNTGRVRADLDAAFRVGYARIPNESLEGVQDGEYVYVESSAPVITAEQFDRLDRYAEGGKVTFTNGIWRYEVRVTQQDSRNLLYNSSAIKPIVAMFEDQNFKFVSFPAGPVFDLSGTMTIDVADEMELFGGKFYVYRYYKGELTRIPAVLDPDDQSLSFDTKELGRFVITDREIPDGTIVEDGFNGIYRR